MLCVVTRTAAPRPRMDTWTCDSAMADSFVRADKTSQDVPRWVCVDQTLLTPAILNLAINARNAMPKGGRNSWHRTLNKSRIPPQATLLIQEARKPLIIKDIKMLASPAMPGFSFRRKSACWGANSPPPVFPDQQEVITNST